MLHVRAWELPKSAYIMPECGVQHSNAALAGRKSGGAYPLHDESGTFFDPRGSECGYLQELGSAGVWRLRSGRRLLNTRKQTASC